MTREPLIKATLSQDNLMRHDGDATTEGKQISSKTLRYERNKELNDPHGRDSTGKKRNEKSGR